MLPDHAKLASAEQEKLEAEARLEAYQPSTDFALQQADTPPSRRRHRNHFILKKYNFFNKNLGLEFRVWVLGFRGRFEFFIFFWFLVSEKKGQLLEFFGLEVHRRRTPACRCKMKISSGLHWCRQFC